MAAQFLELQRRRTVEQRAAVLRQLINALELAETYEWVDTDRMRGDYEAPFGRDGALVNCFAVVPSAVLTTIRLRMQKRRVRGAFPAAGPRLAAVASRSLRSQASMMPTLS